MEMEIVEVLIHKELIGKISTEEKAKLEAWLAESEQNQHAYQEMSTIWEMTKLDDQDMLPVNIDKGLARLNAGIIEEQMVATTQPKVVAMPKRRRFPWMKIAAGFVILLGIAMFSRVFAPKGENQFVEQTQKGELQTLDMPDGSTIVLNEATAMTFFPHIKSERRVSLKGEAFFDVARDESKPFIIETSNATINVLGTSFNVEATVDGETKVVVRSGKVGITPKNGGPQKVLTRGQSILLQNEFAELHEAKALVLDSYKGLLVFNNTKLDEVFAKLNLRFGKKIQWNSDQLKNCEFTGKLDDNSLPVIIEKIKTVFNIESVTFSDDQIELVGGYCN